MSSKRKLKKELTLFPKLKPLLNVLQNPKLKDEFKSIMDEPDFVNTLREGEHAEFVQLVIDSFQHTQINKANLILELIEDMIANGYVRHIPSESSPDVADSLLERLILVRYPANVHEMVSKCLSLFICTTFTEMHNFRLEETLVGLFKYKKTIYHNDVISTFATKYKLAVELHDKNKYEDVMFFLRSIAYCLSHKVENSANYFVSFVSQCVDELKMDTKENIQHIIEIIAPELGWGESSDLVELWRIIINHSLYQFFPFLGICITSAAITPTKNSMKAVTETISNNVLSTLFYYGDYQINQINIIENMIKLLMDDIKKGDVMTINSLSEIFRSVSLYGEIKDGKEYGNYEEYVEQNKKKQQIKELLESFNEKGYSALNKMIEFGCIENNPKSIVKFLLSDELSPEIVGSVLCKNNDLCQQCLKEYINQLDLFNIDLDEALRRLFYHFKMIGESQIVDRVFSFFCDRYLECNPELKQYFTPTQIEQFSTTLLILATESHNPNMKMKAVDTFDKFIKILTEFQIDYDKHRLLKIYKRVQKLPFVSRVISPICRPINIYQPLNEIEQIPLTKELSMCMFDSIWKEFTQLMNETNITIAHDNILFTALASACLLHRKETKDIAELIVKISNCDLSTEFDVKHVVYMGRIISTVMECSKLLGDAWGPLLNVLINYKIIENEIKNGKLEMKMNKRKSKRKPMYPKQFTIDESKIQINDFKNMISNQDKNGYFMMIDFDLIDSTFDSLSKSENDIYCSFVKGLIAVVQTQITTMTTFPLQLLVKVLTENSQREMTDEIKEIIDKTIDCIVACTFHPSNIISTTALKYLKDIIIVYKSHYNAFISIISDSEDPIIRLTAVQYVFDLDIPEDHINDLYTCLRVIPDRKGKVTECGLVKLLQLYKKYPQPEEFTYIYNQLISRKCSLGLLEQVNATVVDIIKEHKDHSISLSLMSIVASKIIEGDVGADCFRTIEECSQYITSNLWINNLFNNRSEDWINYHFPLLIRSSQLEKWKDIFISYGMVLVMTKGLKMQELIIKALEKEIKDNVITAKVGITIITQLYEYIFIGLVSNKTIEFIDVEENTKTKRKKTKKEYICEECKKECNCLDYECFHCGRMYCKECHEIYSKHVCELTVPQFNSIDMLEIDISLTTFEQFCRLCHALLASSCTNLEIYNCLTKTIHSWKGMYANDTIALLKNQTVRMYYINLYISIIYLIFNSLEKDENDFLPICIDESKDIISLYNSTGNVNVQLPMEVLATLFENLMMIKKKEHFDCIYNAIHSILIDMIMTENVDVRRKIVELMKKTIH